MEDCNWFTNVQNNYFAHGLRQSNFVGLVCMLKYVWPFCNIMHERVNSRYRRIEDVKKLKTWKIFLK